MTRSPEGPSVAGDGARRAPSPAGRPRRGGTDWRKRFEVALLTGPAIIIFVTFVILPVGMAAYYGFYKWKGFGPPTDFAGFKNYVTIFKDSSFHEALQHNGMIVVLSLIIQGPVAVVMALLINQKMRGRSLLRVLIFVPYVISEVIVGTGRSLMLQTSGAVNDLIDGRHVRGCSDGHQRRGATGHRGDPTLPLRPSCERNPARQATLRVQPCPSEDR